MSDLHRARIASLGVNRAASELRPKPDGHQLIRIVAPPTPGCFADRLAWAEYLSSAMDIKSAATKPFKAAIYQPSFDWCKDCTTEHRRQMVAEKRCNPPTVTRPVRTKEAA